MSRFTGLILLMGTTIYFSDAALAEVVTLRCHTPPFASGTTVDLTMDIDTAARNVVMTWASRSYGPLNAQINERYVVWQRDIAGGFVKYRLDRRTGTLLEITTVGGQSLEAPEYPCERGGGDILKN